MEARGLINLEGFVPLKWNENDYTNRYLINENGDIYSTFFHRLLKHQKDKDGYHRVALRPVEGLYKELMVAQLVLYTFNGNPPISMTDPTSEHKDGNVNNNNINNLEWMERSKNSSSRKNKGVGIENHEAVLQENQVIEICEMLMTNKYKLSEIAKKYGVSMSTISDIKRKKNWTHLTENYNFKRVKQISDLETNVNRIKIYSLMYLGYDKNEIKKMGFTPQVISRIFDDQYKNDGLLKDAAIFIINNTKLMRDKEND